MYLCQIIYNMTTMNIGDKAPEILGKLENGPRRADLDPLILRRRSKQT